MAQERPAHTLQTSALVNEAFVKLAPRCNAMSVRQESKYPQNHLARNPDHRYNQLSARAIQME